MMRDAGLSPTWLAALLVLGLVIGFGLQWKQHPQNQRASNMSWIAKAASAITPSAFRKAPELQADVPRFILRGTMVSSDPSGTMATFDVGGRLYVLNPRSTLPGVGRLLEVADNSAWLEVNGRRVQVFIESPPASGGAPLEVSSVVQDGTSSYDISGAGAARRRGSVPGPQFVVPNDIPRISDAPYNQPELNASPRPGQTIDTTVWD